MTNDEHHCEAGVLIERVNEAIAAVGASTVPGEMRTIPGVQALMPLAVHSSLSTNEVNCFLSSMSEQFLALIVREGAITEQMIRGALAQAFLAGAFSGKDAA